MFKIFLNAWRVQDIRRKLLFIFLLLLIYRFGNVIPLPGIDLDALYLVRYGGGAGTPTTIFNMIAGGQLGTLFTMGIAPYITASIIMQLLTYAIPKLSQMQKEGEEGRKLIQQITRYMSVGLAALQATAMVFSWTRMPLALGDEMVLANLFRHPNIFSYFMAIVAMMTGTIFIMWLAELIGERGIGNGASFLIFANILSQMPMGALILLDMALGGGVTGWIYVLVMLIVFVFIIAFVVLVHEGERRIPVQNSKKAANGRTMFGAQSSYIPLKVNIAGVLSIIFAISLLHFPIQISGFFPISQVWMERFGMLDPNTHVIGGILYVILIFVFTHFYTSFAVNTVEMAENMKKSGGFIPGIRPGKPTSDFIQVSVNRLAWIGSVFYSLIALIPIALQWITGVPLGFGGTTLLIVTGVALEFIKQLESQLLTRHYKGFLD